MDKHDLKNKVDKILIPIWHSLITIHKPDPESLLHIEDVKVNKRELMNLIDRLDDPKQQKPVIPEYIADWINRSKKIYGASLTKIFAQVNALHAVASDGSLSNRKVQKWILENEMEFAIAYREGFSIQKEKRYRVYDSFTDSVLIYNEDTNCHEWHKNDEFLHEYETVTGTVEEIKAISPAYVELKQGVS